MLIVCSIKRTFLTIAIVLFQIHGLGQVNQDRMIAHFIDVGQGDATLLEFPCGAILIDAGSQDADHEERLIEYLTSFFERRSDLNYTLNLVIITHAHLDHNLALDNVAENFIIERYIDNGLRVGSGKHNQNKLRNGSRAMGILYATYSYYKITLGENDGHTDTIVDPFVCDETDPEITLLSGRFTSKPAGWTKDDYDNGNNHSLVLKVEFGEVSFLFTGDLEDAGIEKLIETYDPGLLDVDVLRVGHHGSHNATSPELLKAVTPDYAFISCGKWDYGKNSRSLFTTYRFGHPRKNILQILSEAISGIRPDPIVVKAGTGSRRFEEYLLEKNIYATAWDGNIQLQAHKDGTLTIFTNQ